VDKKDLEIKISIMKTIYDAMLPIYHRLNCLLDDLIYKKIMMSETDKSVLLEYCSCAAALKVIFENYFELYPNPRKEEKITLPYEEYLGIMSLAKTVELAMRTNIGGLTLQEH